MSDQEYFNHEIPKGELNKWKQKRREKDRVNRLLEKNGFHDRPDGRTGIIYYVENGRVCEIEYELSGVKEFDILINFDQLEEWFLPNNSMISPNEKAFIKEKLNAWLKEKKIRADI